MMNPVIGLVISRGMTRPISELVQGTREITRGNYDYVLRVPGTDELGILARRFMAMSSSLKEKITDLQTKVLSGKEPVYVMLLEIQAPPSRRCCRIQPTL